MRLKSSPKEEVKRESLHVSVPKVEGVKKALYWLGSLPAEGTFETLIPTTEKNSEGEYSRIGKTTASKLWKQDQWVGRCRHFQSLSVKGCEFPAWTEQKIRKQQSIENGPAWPGIVVAFTDDEIKVILERLKTTYVRVVDGKGSIISLEDGKYNASQIDKNNPNTIPIYTPQIVFNRHTDTPVAEYVYIQKVSDDDTTPRDQYYELVPSMEAFLRNPPDPVAKLEEEAASA